ncbi:MAG: hypothetical protein KIT22_19150, partial [Verrucomicrobiae bacterium]|nr:hypothetical protein [Verrucomicrobiae bacterium]
PAKAPADSAWLNPFGPLTTKAAKAAKPRLSYTGDFETVSEDVGADSFSLSGALKNALPGSTSPDEIALPYSSASGPLLNLQTRSLLLEYARRMATASRPGMPTSFQLELSRALGEPRFYSLPVAAADYSAVQAQALFASNGITVLRESSTAFRALPTRDLVSTPVNPRPYALLYTYSLIIALVCGTAGLPHILVRFYTNPDGAAAKRTTMWVMILIGIFYVFPPVFGVMGRNLMPSLYDGSGVNGTDGIVLKLPTVLGGRFGPLGSILSGITCAGAFAAFMSTFSGLLVSMTGALAHDVYGRILRPQSTPAERLRMFKIAAVLIGAVAIGLGTLVENFEINFMVGQAFAIAAASYFPLLFMSVWWRGMTVRGAATGMLTGGLLAVAAISLTSWTTFLTAQGAKFQALGRGEPAWFVSLKAYSLSEFWAGHPLLRILCEQPAIWAVPLAILLMIVVSKRTRDQVPADIREKMLVLHAPEALGLRQDYIRDHHA